MSYTVRLTPKAERFLEKAPEKLGKQLVGKIARLATEPRPRGCKKIKPDNARYRIRSGDYRIIYEIHDDILIVLVVLIGHRQGIYNRL